MQDVREARTTFFVNLDGRPVKINRGDLIRVDHPLYIQYAKFFKEPGARVVRFETAVNDPDELRSLDLSHMPEAEAVHEDMSLEELKTIAHDEGLATYGAKSALVERINKKRGL